MESVDRRDRVKRRLVVVFGVGLLLALATVLSSAALAAPTKAGKLTPEQRDKFVEGAKAIAGLSNEEIARALRDPDAIAAIPVSVKDTQERPPAPVSDEDIGAQAAANYCTYLIGTRYYVNINNERLFSLSGKKSWCFDYSAVTYAPLARSGYSVTEKGIEYGWKYTGIVDRAEGYKYYDGLSRGAHSSRFVGRFRSCSTEGGCTTVYPQYTGVGRYDGTGGQTIRTLPGAPTG